MGPFKGHQAIEPSIGHRVRIFFHLLPSPSLKKGEFRSLVAFFFSGHLFFNSNIENIHSHNLFEEKKMINLGKWEKEGEQNGHFVIVLKEWE
jgi:hypothetical protein